MAKTKEKKKQSAAKQNDTVKAKKTETAEVEADLQQEEINEEDFAAVAGTEDGTDTSAEEIGEAAGTDSTDEFSMQAAEFQNLDSDYSEPSRDSKLELLMDLSLPVSIELGRTNLPIKDILNLQRGSIVEFEKLASEPVDILINGKKMAEGEVVVIEKHFGIRITNLINATDRIKSLGR